MELRRDKVYRRKTNSAIVKGSLTLAPADSRSGPAVEPQCKALQRTFMNQTMDHYIYVWEFNVPIEFQEAFERYYGPNGAWAELFRLSPDYIETLLLKDQRLRGRYVTVDRWHSKIAYLAFRDTHSQQYDQLDRECECFTSSETFLGEFTEHIS